MNVAWAPCLTHRRIVDVNVGRSTAAEARVGGPFVPEAEWQISASATVWCRPLGLLALPCLTCDLKQVDMFRTLRNRFDDREDDSSRRAAMLEPLEDEHRLHLDNRPRRSEQHRLPESQRREVSHVSLTADAGLNVTQAHALLVPDAAEGVQAPDQFRPTNQGGYDLGIDNGMYDSGETSVLTDASGNYSFTFNTPGTYIVSVQLNRGYCPDVAALADLRDDQSRRQQDQRVIRGESRRAGIIASRFLNARLRASARVCVLKLVCCTSASWAARR